ncbi:hypothetical protein [Laceyella sacchari]|uniref:hypothetical protein n=1 Tax=Laceyella sacchari TaxID=37482 RepID=UPI001304F143|nr:hypothetical protein [Laceyella sacchari]
MITETKDVKWQGDILRKLVHLYGEENTAADKAIETSEQQGKVVSLLYHIKGLCIR